MKEDEEYFSKNFIINSKTYKPKFNLGDSVCFVTDEDEKVYILYGYIIEIGNIIKYRICRNGSYEVVQGYEIKKLE